MLRKLLIEALQSKTEHYSSPIWVRLEHYVAWAQLLDKHAVNDLERRAVQSILDRWYNSLNGRYELSDQGTVVIKLVA